MKLLDTTFLIDFLGIKLFPVDQTQVCVLNGNLIVIVVTAIITVAIAFRVVTQK